MPSIRRTRHGRGTQVDTRHPDCGWLVRGTIRPKDVASTDSPGVAGHLVWAVATYDYELLDPVCGDYVQAEQALLAATTELD